MIDPVRHVMVFRPFPRGAMESFKAKEVFSGLCNSSLYILLTNPRCLSNLTILS